jgi:RNA polymerase sigma factor (sigma-70 family)
LRKKPTTRLSHEEQYELLRQVAESRRIRHVKQELQLASPMRTVTDLQLARATGYGDVLHEVPEALDAGDAARNFLITSNMGLVHYCVSDVLKRRRPLQSVTYEDLVQEGCIGLARAVDRWNFAAAGPDGKFSTYAVYWIRAAVLRGIAERDDLVRVPEHVSTAIAKISAAAQTLGINLDGHDPMSAAWKEATAAKELAETAGLTDRQLQEAMKVRDRRNGGILSFESWMQQGKDYESDVGTAATDSNRAVDAEHLKQTLARFLRPREVEAVSWRYGLNTSEDASSPSAACSKLLAKRDYVAEAERELFGDAPSPAPPRSVPVRGKSGEAMSFSEVGNRMHISAEYGRKLCHAALDKLRRAAEEGMLEPALLF